MTQAQLAEKEMSGLMSLLKDSEEKTLNLIAQQINGFDNVSLKALNEMASKSADEALTDNWYYVSKLSLSYSLKEWRKNPDLESGLFLLAKLINPGLDESKCKETLDKYAERVQRMLKPDSSEHDIIEAINHVLFLEENFCGNQVLYYDIKNNFIDTVLENKTGNPITLSCLFILVARRLNVAVHGVGTPGHFIVQWQDKFLDPFFGGREITKDECHIRAQELGVFWREEYLEPIDDVAIVTRSLRNLIAIHKKNKKLDKASDACELLQALQ